MIISDSEKCINYLINSTPPKLLSTYDTSFITHMKINNDNEEYYELYYNKIMHHILYNNMKIEFNPKLTDIFSQLFFNLIYYSDNVNEKYIDILLNNDLFGFIQRMEHPEYRQRVERLIATNKPHIIEKFIKYYTTNQIDLTTLYKTYLINNHKDIAIYNYKNYGNFDNKYEKIVKQYENVDNLFKMVSVKSKFHFGNYRFYNENGEIITDTNKLMDRRSVYNEIAEPYEFIMEEEEYTLSTFLYFYGETTMVNEVLENPLFETELINLFKFYSRTNTLSLKRPSYFSIIISYDIKYRDWDTDEDNAEDAQQKLSCKLLSQPGLSHLALVKDKLTANFWNFLRELNNKCLNEQYKKEVDDEINKLSNQVDI